MSDNEYRALPTRPTRFAYVVGLLFLPVVSLNAGETVERRARPPEWAELPGGLFFKDAFRDGLRGERPAALSSTDAGRPLPSRGNESPTDGTSPGVTDWAKLISPATLEDEMKAINVSMDEALRTEGDFKSQRHQDVRVDLATAAVLWAVIDQYEGPVRWQADAATMRDRFGRLAQQAKVGSSQVYREAKGLRQDLQDLIRGSRLSSARRELSWTWPDVADRVLMMQRLETAVQQNLAAGLASDRDMVRQRDKLLRESELVAAMAQVLSSTDMPDAADADYEAICDELQRAALQLRKAVKTDNLSKARQAHAELKRRCVTCHELYRA